ncbi:hypothetical protein WDW89_04550 [Deltaproteobacteria bacterium TL4]
MQSVNHNRMTIGDAAAKYLKLILEHPLRAKTLQLSKGAMKWKVDYELAEQLNETTLNNLKQGRILIDLNSLERLFEDICSGVYYKLEAKAMSLDLQNHIELSLPDLLAKPLTDDNFMEVLRLRYDISTYLFAFSLFEQSQQRDQELENRIKSALGDIEELEDAEISHLCQFLTDTDQIDVGKHGFYFDPVPKEEKLEWKRWERRSNYLGEYPPTMDSPEQLDYPAFIVNSPKRPVSILFDVSMSMSNSLDVALRATEELIYQLEGHPVSFVLFSSMSGLLKAGMPFISKGKSFKEEIAWLYPVVQAVHAFPRLTGWTSIGSGVMQGQRIASSIAVKMKAFPQWMNRDHFSSHCILVSDNLHNSPRDLSVKGKRGEMVIQHPENVVAHALNHGCVIHNLMVCPAPQVKRPETSLFKGPVSLTAQIQHLRYKEVLAHDFLVFERTRVSKQREIRARIYLRNDLGKNGKRVMIVEHNETRKKLFTMEGEQQGEVNSIDLACFIIYVRDYVVKDGGLLDAFDFLLQGHPLTLNDFHQNPVNVEKISAFYAYLFDDVDLNFLGDLSSYDVHPFEAFEVSHFISASQKELMNLQVTPVLLDLPEPVVFGKYTLTDIGYRWVLKEMKKRGYSLGDLECIQNSIPEILDQPFYSKTEFVEMLEQRTGQSRYWGKESYFDGMVFVRGPIQMLQEWAINSYAFCSNAYFGMKNVLAIKKTADQLAKQLLDG